MVCRNKLFLSFQFLRSASLLLDALFLSLCIELAYDGSREMLVGVLGVGYLGGVLLARA